MAKFILINGIRREMTAEEEAKYNQDVIDTKAARDADKIKAETKEANKTSGKAKLKTGEALTDAEVEALFG